MYTRIDMDSEDSSPRHSPWERGACPCGWLVRGRSPASQFSAMEMPTMAATIFSFFMGANRSTPDSHEHDVPAGWGVGGDEVVGRNDRRHG